MADGDGSDATMDRSIAVSPAATAERGGGSERVAVESVREARRRRSAAVAEAIARLIMEDWGKGWGQFGSERRRKRVFMQRKVPAMAADVVSV